MTDAPATRARPRPVLAAASWALTVAWSGVIFAFSAQPGNRIPGRFSEIGHLGEYFLFGLLIYSAMRASGQGDRAGAVAILVASAFGMTDEFHQHFVFMRTPDVVDWGMDTVGAACGAMAGSLIARMGRGSRSHRSAGARPQ